jgi:D-alanine--D-alanine ligase
MEKRKSAKVRLAVLCGGPSLERGISLNSARSLLDHLGGELIEIVPVYFDHKRKAYHISTSQLYSNTPSDFDFKLARTAKTLNDASLVKLLKSVDVVFPAIHGAFGEDGTIQAFLEKHKIPFIGSGSTACKRAFDKFTASELIRKDGFYSPPSLLLKIYGKTHARDLKKFFADHKLTRVVVKPASGGSSIGVFSVSTPEEALEKSKYLFSKRMDTRVVVEPFAEGREFTVVLLENKNGVPVAVLPTEIVTSYEYHQIFDFRKKYLPTNHVHYHCPPRLSDDVVHKIQNDAEKLFTLLGMRDFARFDGWVFPDGRIWFSDFNPISGMEQNSFLFQQSARVGFSHQDVLFHIVRQALKRQGLTLPQAKKVTSARKPVPVLFGGGTAERQVSLMSGTNVWLKLRKSKKYIPEPYLLDPDQKTVWKLPYALILNHTVEEIAENAQNAIKDDARFLRLMLPVVERLTLAPGEAGEKFFLPQSQTLDQFINGKKFIFVALHGGIGENGELQALLEKRGVKYNGSNSVVSNLCMDKWATNEKIRDAHVAGVSIPEHTVLPTENLASMTETLAENTWKDLIKTLGTKSIIVKPRGDGCSAGVVRLFSARDLYIYAQAIAAGTAQLAPGTITNQSGIVEMPTETPESLVCEAFIETDVIRAKGKSLKHTRRGGWIEVTVGVLGERGKLKVLSPSLTVAEGEVLSLEEKFQGGTGINITPPPKELVRPKAIIRAKELIGTVAKTVGIRGYARIDAFMHIDSGNIIVIEINTLPGLTPSTVLYHQGLAETPQIFPCELLERIIKEGGY